MTQVFILALLIAVQSPNRPLPGGPPAAGKAAAKEGGVIAGPTKVPPCAAEAGVAKLPFARGRRFCSLDDYLAHLEAQGAMDLPWWRQVRPGVYERVTRMPGAPRDIATRAELMKRFGFSH